VTARRTAGGALLVTGILVLAFNLRAMITGLPPVFPELQAVLHVSAGTLAVLASVPVLCFGIFSGAGAPLSRRFGEERVLGAAVLLIATGLVLRTVAPSVLLFPGTIVAGAGIALMNVLLPSLVKRRMPERAGLLIGVYLLMLAVGAIAASALAVPVFNAAGRGLPAARLALGVWAAPALVAALVWLPQLRYRTVPAGPGPAEDADIAADFGVQAGPRPVRSGRSEAGRHRPASSGAASSGASSSGAAGALAMRRHALAWQVTLFMGLQSLSYYATLSWFPTMFRDRGVSAAYAGTLLALMNLGNAVTALIVPWLAQRLPDQRWLAAAAMTATGAGLAGAGFGPSVLAAPSVLVLGLGQGATLGLAIYYTMARAPDPATAASLSAFAQGIGYLIASTGPLLIGLLHTATGGWTIPLTVLLIVAVVQLVTGWLAGRARTVPARSAGPVG
jgi:MFS transporter, CP family, cyanate transporter